MSQEEIDSNVAQVGRILHFVIDTGTTLRCIPAIVVQESPNAPQVGVVNLAAIDLSEDLQPQTFVYPNHAVRVFRTWHWPRECIKLSKPQEPFVGMDNKRRHHSHVTGVVDMNNCYACLLENSK